MRAPGLVILTDKEILPLLSLSDCIGAVEEAFRMYAGAKAPILGGRR